MTQNNQFKFILNLAHVIKFLVPTHGSLYITIYHTHGCFNVRISLSNGNVMQN